MSSNNGTTSNDFLKAIFQREFGVVKPLRLIH